LPILGGMPFFYVFPVYHYLAFSVCPPLPYFPSQWGKSPALKGA
jgi:hypothetical protein